MTTPMESLRRAVTHSVSVMRRREWRSALTVGLILAGAFVAMLGVSTSGHPAGVLASLAGFATTITMMAAAVIGWERVIGNARSDGLVEGRNEP
jgi:hypothetical protein